MKTTTKKTLEYLLTLFVIITLNFFIPRIMPGDPFTFVSSEENSVNTVYSDEEVARLKEYYGLDKPLAEQYGNYLKNTIKGDFGYSIYFNDTVLNLIGGRIVYTLPIALASLVLSCVLGCLLGCVSAYHRNRFFDRSSYLLITVFSQIPSFIIGIFFLFTFAGKLGWFPLSGAMTIFATYDTPLAQIRDILHHAFLPVLTLTLAHIGEFYLLSRNSMISVLSKDYITTAKAKGLAKKRVLYVHALKNAVLPIITRLCMSLGTILGGAVLIENVFNYPGLGTMMRQAITYRDYTLIQGIFLFFAVSVLLMNALADILYRKLDPRVAQ
ncbi:MAG: ABC transporter permease [Clostridiales bacterium]|nr:ABC transporter permease [Clostridiales bacterium]